MSLMFDRPERRQELWPHGVQKVFPPAPLQRANPLAAPLDVVLNHHLAVRTVVLVWYPKIVFCLSYSDSSYSATGYIQ